MSARCAVRGTMHERGAAASEANAGPHADWKHEERGAVLAIATCKDVPVAICIKNWAFENIKSAA